MIPQMKILYGPPGTGKTWLAAREALMSIDKEAYKKVLSEEGQEGIQRLHKKMVKDGRIVWVTFHPSYSYEDFIEGYRPCMALNGQIFYEIKDGPFKSICKLARGERIDLRIGELLTTEDKKPYGIVVDKDAGGWIVQVTPNRKDQIAETMNKYVDRFTIRQVKSKNLSPAIFSIPGTNLVPLSRYGINSLKDYQQDGINIPAPDPNAGEDEMTRVGATARRIIGAIAKISSSDLSNSAHYGAVYRRLNELEKNAQPVPVAMVIDEINRADLSRVFGELITLLESDKREGMPEERKILLPYSQFEFSVPASVSIIGTMNTIDKSISSMDYAMRRRFHFILIDAEPQLCPINYGGLNLRKCLIVINKRLDVMLGNDFRVGHALFMEENLNRIIKLNGWSDKDSNIRAVAFAFRTALIPVVIEYFQSDWRRVRAIFTASVKDLDLTLFESNKPDPGLTQSLPDEYDLDDSVSYALAEWWNPNSPKWDQDRFKQIIVALAAWD